MIIDTHTHLYSEQFNEDIDEVIERALNVGVKRFYLPAIDSSYHKSMEKLQKKYPENIFLMMGLHPCDVKNETYIKELEIVESKLNLNQYAAIGEIGIDLYWDSSTLKIQEETFRKQINWAKERKLPIVVHTRNSINEIIKILQEEKTEDLLGIIHCFSGNSDDAKKIIDLNFLLGIGGVVTFKNGGIDKFLENIPIKNIVLETDSPYLAPVPYRGKRNESSYIIEVIKKLSDIYKILPEKISEITTENALKLFKI